MAKMMLREAETNEDGRLRVWLTCLSEMRGAYPDIPLPEDIDRAALGDDALFVTLPIGQAGARSRNGRVYSRAAVEGMVAQINAKRPEGMWGHLTDAEAGTRYDPPAIRWLAALLDRDGVAWGKGLPLTAETREYYRLAKATNARVGTSLYAWAALDGETVTGLELITLDLADPARVGVPVTAAQPVLTGEMEGSPRMARLEGDATAAREDAARLEIYREAVERAAELLSVSGEGVVEGVRDLLAERAALLDEVIVSMVERAVKVPSVRPVVLLYVRARQPATRAAVAETVTAVLAEPDVQALLRDGLQWAMGPAHGRPANRETDGERYFSIPK